MERHKQLFEEYKKAQAELVPLLESKDWFVATYSVYTDEKGSFSVCVFTRGVKTWLPDADYISFVNLETGETHHMVPFTDTLRTKLKMTQVEDQTPIYYKTSAFPRFE